MMLKQNGMNKCFSYLQVLGLLLSLATMILALVVGFMYFSCNQKMSTWLLVTGFMYPTIFVYGTVINCFSLKDIFKAEESDELVKSLLRPAFICTFCTYIGVSIFFIAWTIYGAIMFFPIISGPYEDCSVGEDDVKVLVITSFFIIILKTIFLFCPSVITLIIFKVWKLQEHKEDIVDQGENTEELGAGSVKR